MSRKIDNPDEPGNRKIADAVKRATESGLYPEIRREQPAQGEPNVDEILSCGCLSKCKGHAAQAMSQAGLQAHVYSPECPTCGSKKREIRLCPLCHINAKGHRFEDHPKCDDNDWHNFKPAGAVEGMSAEQFRKGYFPHYKWTDSRAEEFATLKTRELKEKHRKLDFVASQLADETRELREELDLMTRKHAGTDAAYIAAAKLNVELREERDALRNAPMRFMVTGGPVVMSTDFDAMKERAERAESALREARELLQRVHEDHTRALSSGTGKIAECDCRMCNRVLALKDKS